MLTYTFTTREKFLIALLVVVLGGFAWYYFVFATVQLRMSSLDSEIRTTQEQIDAATLQVHELDSMRNEIAQFEAEGRTPVEMPAYDNSSAVMMMLNNTIGIGKFKYSADNELDVQTAGVVKRGVTVEFNAASYEAARAILDALAEGEYPCSVESVSITDESARRASTTTEPIVTVAHLTFYESDELGIFADQAASDSAANEEAK
jgi:hypothetical protein